MKTNLVSNKTAISTAVIALVVIVVVAAVGGGIYFAATQNKPSSPSATPTPSPAVSSIPTPIVTVSTAPTETVNPSATVAPKVADASSLKYSVSLSADTPSALVGTYTYYGKDLGTSSSMVRIEYTDLSNHQSVIILNGAQQKSWKYSDGKWSEIPAYGTYHNVWQGYVDSLASWNGIGEYSFTLSAATVRIYDIRVNPVLADSLFQHS